MAAEDPKGEGDEGVHQGVLQHDFGDGVAGDAIHGPEDV